MLTKVLRIAAVLGVAFACAAIAPAADAMTIRTGDPKLSGRVAISVPVVVSCSPFASPLVHISGGISVSVQQAAGRDIAFGTGSVSNFTQPPPFACDGTEQTVPVTVLANTSGPPFHGGRAVMSASASASAGEPCFPGSTNCFFNIVGQSASTGAVEVRL